MFIFEFQEKSLHRTKSGYVICTARCSSSLCAECFMLKSHVEFYNDRNYYSYGCSKILREFYFTVIGKQSAWNFIDFVDTLKNLFFTRRLTCLPGETKL